MPNLRQRHAFFKTTASPTRTIKRACDHPGCAAPAEHKAPKTKDLKDYYWFCLEHARDYNSGWDYFKDMSPDAIDAFRYADMLGHRPTWPLGSLGGGFGARRRGRAETEATPQVDRAAADHLARRLPAHGLSALATLDLQPPVGFADIRERYRDLVRRYHPDLRGNAPDGEARLKAVTQAYMVLKALYRPSADDSD